MKNYFYNKKKWGHYLSDKLYDIKYIYMNLFFLNIYKSIFLLYLITKQND